MPQNAPLDALSTGSVLISPSPSTAGQLLRAARTRAGMDLAVLSAHLKVPVRELEALEADQHDPAKGPVFVRALTSSICRYLRVDSAPVLALLPAGSGQLESKRMVHTARVVDESSWRPSWRLPSWRLMASPVRGAVTLMLALTAALIWMPGPSQWAWLDSMRHAWPFANVEKNEAPGVVVTDVAPVALGTASESVAVVSTATEASTPVAASLVVQRPSAAVPVQRPQLSFSASADSWVEVRNAQNEVLLSRMFKAGENTQLEVSGVLKVVIGRAAAVDVRFKGEPFDLKPHTQITVARFEVKE